MLRGPVIQWQYAYCTIYCYIVCNLCCPTCYQTFIGELNIQYHKSFRSMPTYTSQSYVCLCVCILLKVKVMSVMLETPIL